jgi:hypothetical protein
VANLLLSQQHPGGWPCVDREPIDADYPPLINPPDSPPDPSLPQPARAPRKTRGGAKKEGRPGKRKRSLNRRRQPVNDYQVTGSRSSGDGQEYRWIRCGRYLLGGQAGQGPVLKGHTPLGRWKDARLTCRGFYFYQPQILFRAFTMDPALGS